MSSRKSVPQLDSKQVLADDLRCELKLCLEQVLPPMLTNLLAQERVLLIQELRTNKLEGDSPIKRTSETFSKSVLALQVARKMTTPTSAPSTPHVEKAPQEVPLLPEETCELFEPPSSHREVELLFRSDNTRELFSPLAQEETIIPALLPRRSGTIAVIPPWWSSRRALEAFTRSTTFEHVFGALILIYSVFLGLETHHHTMMIGQQVPMWYFAFEGVFAVVFTFEIMFRAAVQKANFFLQEPIWNIFDTLALFVQILVQILQLMPGLPLGDALLLWLRPLRVARLVRVIRNFESLRSITLAIGASMESLFATFVILCIVLYACSIVFTQIATASLQHGAINEEGLQMWFGNLFRTVLTLTESIMGGLSWDEAVRPLIDDAGPFSGVVYSLFMIFCIIAILNMVTGVYVDRATRMANSERDMILVQQISHLFREYASSDEHGVTWEKFEAKLAEKDMQDYFQDIDIDPSQAPVLFELLDVDHSGEVDTGEMIDGLIRLHGTAKALDIRICQYELWRVHEALALQANALEDIRSKVGKATHDEDDFAVGDCGMISRQTSPDSIASEVMHTVSRRSNKKATLMKHLKSNRKATLEKISRESIQ